MKQHSVQRRRAPLAGLFTLALMAFAPPHVAGQSPNHLPAAMDAWRAGFAAQLDAQLAQLKADEGRTRKVAPTDYKDDARPVPDLLPSLELKRREPWFPSVIAVLRNYGLPSEILSVAAVESSFDPAALSPQGARGLWQLMPETARRYGLIVEPRRDERLDPLKSTSAAARYLRDLYEQFQDWPLALAAYNAGEDRVQRSLERVGARDFWTLSRLAALPEETLGYVPAVLARAGRAPAAPSAGPRLEDASGGKQLGLVRAPASIVYARMGPAF